MPAVKLLQLLAVVLIGKLGVIASDTVDVLSQQSSVQQSVSDTLDTLDEVVAVSRLWLTRFQHVPLADASPLVSWLQLELRLWPARPSALAPGDSGAPLWLPPRPAPPGRAPE